MTFGSNLQSLREAQGLSQKELANQVGVSTGMIAEWESDESSPNLTELSRLSKTLGIPADDLLNIDSGDNDTSSKEIAEEPRRTTSPIAEPIQKPGSAPLPSNKNKKTALIICISCISVGIIALAIAFILMLPDTPFADNAAAIEAADASVVTIFCYDYDGKLAATGSGFVAFDSKTIVTNYHVMTSAYTCKISTNQDISYKVTHILAYSKELDLAILQTTDDTGLQPLKLGNSKDIKKGETVVAIGSPLGIKNTVSTGVLSGRLMEDNMDVLQFTAPISSGSSGGALFDNHGNVIGITYASYIDGQNLNLAIPIELASDLYNSKGSSQKTSVIYTDEHPYMQRLEGNPNICYVTFSDLCTSPAKYNGKIVGLIAYVSSTYDSNQINSVYLSQKDDVSHDNDFDKQVYYDSGGLSVLCSATFDSATVKGTIRSGSRVVVIGTFYHYTSRSFPDKDSWRYMYEVVMHPDIQASYIEVVS